MSGKVVGWAFEQKTRTPTAKLILVKLADNANEDGYCWPSVSLIVKHTGLSERAVRENLRHLEADGLIRVDERMTKRGQASNAYQLAIEGNAYVAPYAPAAGDGVQQVQRPPAMGAPIPCSRCTPIEGTVNEPSLNLPPVVNADRNARAFEARVASLMKKLGIDAYRAWMSEAVFSEGPPPTIILPEFKANWVRNHFSSTLERIFGEGVKVVSAGKKTAVAKESSDCAEPKHVPPHWLPEDRDDEAA
jgi:hypothetical protein